jgi:hypothetical protein
VSPALAGALAPPTLTGVGVENVYISPNGDQSQDTLSFQFTLGGDSAQVVVAVRPDSVLPDLSHVPKSAGVHRFLVEDQVLAVGSYTVGWDGGDSLTEARVADGRYWVTITAVNSQGKDSTAVDFLVDIVAPEDAVTVPGRQHVNALVHRVEGWGSDKNRLESFSVRIFSSGGSLEQLLCTPCLAETVRFGIDLPDSVAARDTINVTATLRDNAGNQLVRSRFFAVDSLPPPPPALDPLPATVDRPRVAVAGTAADAESVLISLDGAVRSRLRVLGGGRFEITLQNLGLGSHDLSAVSQDRSLNRSLASRTLSFVYQEPMGAVLPERFLSGSFIQVNLVRPARSVSVKIYTLHGRLVRSFEDRSATLFHEFGWDLNDDDGRAVGSGPYVVRVMAEQDDGTAIEKRLTTVVTR